MEELTFEEIDLIEMGLQAWRANYSSTWDELDLLEEKLARMKECLLTKPTPDASRDAS